MYQNDTQADHFFKSNPALNVGPIVKFMLESLEKSGCKFGPENLQCLSCTSDRAGGFALDAGVVLLCANKLNSRKHVQDTIVHELIHAFDHCTVEMEPGNCAHYACTEIRAASLSGDCKFTRELSRGNFGVAMQHQRCVRRRAALALNAIPGCSGVSTDPKTGEEYSVAEETVNRVFEKCFKDTSPFDDIY